jgi:hypothetical protein
MSVGRRGERYLTVPTPGRIPDINNNACTRSVQMSLQEGCLHVRRWLGAPARIGLRYDVLVEAGGLLV